MRHQEVNLDQIGNRLDLLRTHTHSLQNLFCQHRSLLCMSPPFDLSDIVEQRRQEENLSIRDFGVDPCEGCKTPNLCRCKPFDVVDNLKTVLIDGVMVIQIITFQARQLGVFGDDGCQKTCFVHRSQHQSEVVTFFEELGKRGSHSRAALAIRQIRFHGRCKTTFEAAREL